jgi:hypothetical protein
VASVFRIELSAKQETSSKQAEFAIFIMLVSCLADNSILKIEATYSSETSVDYEWDAERYITDDTTLNNHSKIHLTIPKY